MSNRVNKTIPRNNTRAVLIRGGFLVLLVGIFWLSYKYFGLKTIQPNPKLVVLEKSLQDIRAAMNVDSVRQYNIQKVMKIIDKYNKNMPSGMKYEIADEIYNMSVKYTNLDVDLICATITHESGGTWEPEVVSQAGALGLMQVMPALGLWIAHYEGITWVSPEETLFNPIYNIRIGCSMLSTFINMYDLEGGLAAYNGGEKRAAIWLASNKSDGILWSETNSYIPHILKYYKEFKTLTL
ncbi:MAG: lytic transglycosylase domain-containing protein [bacterium]